MVQNSSRRSRLRQREILLEAARQFRSKGFTGSGMREIAATLGMTVGNLYYYFESKEALLGFCQEEALDRLEALVRWVEEQSDLPADQRLALLVEGHVACLNETIPGSLAHMQVEDLPRELRPGIVERRAVYEFAWRRLVEEGIAEGRFRRVDSKVAALALLGAVNWTVKWFRADGERSALDIGEQFADQLVRGLLTRGDEFVLPERPIPSALGEIPGHETEEEDD